MGIGKLGFAGFPGHCECCGEKLAEWESDYCYACTEEEEDDDE